MYKNGLSYISSSLFVLLAHFAMLAVVFFNGNYEDTSVVLKLAEIVIGFDLVYFIVMLFYKQMTYSIDFMLLLVLNMSLIFQSCYGGAIGYMDFSGNLDVCIAIRTAVKKGKKVYVQAGAGIVADSIPENEYQECANKAGAVIEAIRLTEEVCRA